ncbi:hypothetical protein Hanom_Chr03g00259041 [Helianthus anomalus]
MHTNVTSLQTATTMMADRQRKKLQWFIIPQSGHLILYLHSSINFLFPMPSAKKVETETKATGNTVKQQRTRNRCLVGSEKIKKDTNHVFLCQERTKTCAAVPNSAMIYESLFMNMDFQPGHHAHSFKELSQHGRFTL